MDMEPHVSNSADAPRLTRRDFLRTTATVAAAGALLGREAVAASSAAKAGPPITLVQAGRPVATIVTAEDAAPNARAAAAEFVQYIQRMTGAALPVATDKEAPGGTLILIGRSRLTDALAGLDIPNGRTKNLREEGYIIWCRGNRLVLAGNDTEPYLGTRYAVAEMLHRLGVRWFMPGAFGEVVPQTATILVEAGVTREQPDFPMRDFWEHSRDKMDVEFREWKIRNKMNPDIQHWFGVPGDGSIRNYLPGDEQFKAHPEWFALTRDGGRDKNMACMTNRGIIDYFIEKVKDEARKGKRVTSFAPDDGTPRCYDSGCMKMSSAFDGFGSNDRDPLPESSTSQEWFYFVNEILNGVNKEFPDHMISTNGYSNREFAPELPGFNKSKNLVVMFANITACTIHGYDDPRCWQMQRQAEMVRRWCKVSDKVWIYSYNYTMLVNEGTITPMVQRVRRTVPMLKEWGLVGFLDQDEADWSLSGLATRIVRAALEWNTKADVEAVLNDFFTRWYGRAAPPMRAYYDALENAFEQSTAHGHEDVILPRIYTDALMAQLDTNMRAAERLAGSDMEKQHVGVERLIYDHLRAYVAMEKAKQVCDYATAQRNTERMIELKAQMNAITPFMGWYPYPAYDAAWEQKRMTELHGKTHGPEGKLVAVLPAQARFRTDPSDDGRYEGWQRAALDDSRWSVIPIANGWEAAGFQDQSGHSYKGTAWYRFTVEVPQAAAGQDVWLLGPAVVDEAWVWVNDNYVGRREYKQPWFRPHTLDMNVSRFIVPGKPNQITLRVLCNYDVFGASGIYERLFLYAKAPNAPKAAKA